MPVISTSVLPGAPAYEAHREAMLALVDEIRTLEARVRANSEKKRGKFEKRGQLLPRDRVQLLLDPGAPFLELATLAGLGMHDDDGQKDVAGGGNIGGIGFVAGRRCLIVATDSAIKGGAVSPMGLEKGLRLQQIALQNKLPVVTLAESAGANLLYQAELFIKGGRSFANQAWLSAAGIPQITVVHGSSTAGGAYLPGMSDYVVLVRGKSKIFLAGPPLLKAATGEIATDEELGGADLHASVAGTGEYMAEDDAHAVQIAREVVQTIQWQARPPAPDRAEPVPPQYDIEQLAGLVPTDYRKPYEIREVIARVVDGSSFLDFKADYGPHTVCGHARIDGYPCGIIANNGPIDPDGATKATQFIQLCSQTNTPLVFLMNTTGYMVGKDAERRGIVKHGSKMIQAVANAPVPKITLVIGGSWGAGNYGMCGRGFDPRFIFSWPNARVGVMGPEQAGRVMEIVAQEKFRKMGAEIPPDVLEKMRQDIVDRMEPETSALFGTARLWDDGIIDPRDSRRVLSFCLATCAEGEARRLFPNTFGVARP